MIKPSAMNLRSTFAIRPFLDYWLLGERADHRRRRRCPIAPQHAVDLGRLAPDTQVDFVVGLALRRPTALHRYVATRAVGDEPLGPDEFADGVRAERRASTGASSRGCRRTARSSRAPRPGRTTVSAYGRAAVVEALFGVELHQYSDADGSFFAAAGPIAGRRTTWSAWSAASSA